MSCRTDVRHLFLVFGFFKGKLSTTRLVAVLCRDDIEEGVRVNIYTIAIFVYLLFF